jgi:hypothetical protein
MSDFTLLYKKYNSVSNLTSELNSSVITLKRRNIASNKAVTQSHHKIQVADEEVAQANHELLGILTTLEAFYDKQDSSNYLFQLAENPLFRNYILENVEYREHVKKSAEKLRKNQNLTTKELSDIDRFISILDNEASVLYRKLRSTRG